MVVFAVVALFVHGGLFNESFLFVCEVVVCVGFVSCCCCFGGWKGGEGVIFLLSRHLGVNFCDSWTCPTFVSQLTAGK